MSDAETMCEARDLTYRGGKPLAVEPINTTRESVVRRLRDGVSVCVQLEPGDGTHYGLMLTPLGTPDVMGGLGRLGIPPLDALGYLWCTDVVNKRGCPVRFPSPWVLGPHDFEDMSNNKWSQVLLAWWFNRLREVVLP